MFNSKSVISIFALLSFAPLCLKAAPAHALAVQVAGSNALEPPIFVLPKDSIPLELVLKLANSESNDDASVLLWQLALRLERATGAAEDLQFVSLAPTGDSLFGTDPGPISYTELPANNLVASDTNPEFVGVHIGPQVAAPIAEIGLLPIIDAGGLFALTMVPFDPEEPDQTSYWTSDDYEPTPFDNALNIQGNTLLAYIYVIEAGSIAGDFSGNLTVDAADYTVWRDQLGVSFSDVHYRIWKQYYGQRVMEETSRLSVPEPVHLSLSGIAALVALRVRRQVNCN